MREANVPSVLLADMTLGLPITLKNVQDGAEGVVYVDGPMKDDFIQRYKKKYGERPTSYAGYAYDTIMMLDIVRKQVGIEPGKIREGFSSIKNYDGVMGEISIQPNRDASLSFVLMQIKGGKPTLYK
jgi:ABC-type branched-subunit amino acid transport system substrate-binding protein